MKEKINQCINCIRKLGLDSLLVSCPLNITYLTGFRPAEGWLLMTTQGEIFYFTNFLYQAEAEKIKFWKVISAKRSIFSSLKEKILSLGVKRTGFEAKTLPFLEYKKIREELSSEKVSFRETIDLVENLRIQKSPAEVALIKKSIKISAAALKFARKIALQNLTEKKVSIELERFLKLRGDNRVAFHPIVASGKNTAFPHHLSQELPLDKKYFIIDLGSSYYGYCADLTRVYFWGKMPPLFTNVYATVREAQAAAIKKIKEGVKAKEVDRAARTIVEEKGWGKYFGHGLGHGIGLAVHEPPFLNSKNEERLKSGSVITIEPAVYLRGKFGVRIEDIVLVKENGGEVLSGDVA